MKKNNLLSHTEWSKLHNKAHTNFDWMAYLKPTTLAAIVADFEENKEGHINFEVAFAADRLLEDIVGATEADRLVVAASNL